MIRNVRRFVALAFVMVLMCNAVFAGSFNVWKAIEEAGTYETAGELDKALPLWLDIIDYYQAQPEDEGINTNIAIFAKKVGKYYDQTKQYDLAVKYYEMENDYWNKVGNSWGAEDMLRAEEIRTLFEMYVEVEADKKQDLEMYEPVSGIYTGIYSENDPAVGQKFNKTESVYGPHAQYVLYQDWGKMIGSDYIDVMLAERMKDENASFHIAINPMNGLKEVKEDKWIVNWAKQAKQLDMPIFLRFAGEMNGDWVKWYDSPEAYIEKFRLVHDIMEEYAPNVAMVWTPNDTPVESNGNRIEDYYPGDKYVDWVGVNFYVDYYDSGNVHDGDNHLQNPLSHLDYIYELYADRKPIMISETAVTHYSIPNSKDLTDWGVENLKKFYSQLPIKYPRVKAVNYFSLNQANPNYHVGNLWNNYAISENSKMKTAYKSLIKSDYYLGSMDDSVDTTFKQITEDQLSDYDEIYFVVKIPDYKISKIEFYDGDKLLGKDTELPYSFKGDLSKIDNFTVKVYDSKNDLNYTKSFAAPVEEVVEEIVEVVEEPIIVSAGEFKVTIPKFGVALKGSKMNPQKSEYPLFVYNDITYFPMTFNATQGLGLDAKWSDATKTLSISQIKSNGKIKEYEKPATNPSSMLATKPAFKVEVNGKVIDNDKEDYPILVLNNITYFPLTWKWVNDEFGWKINFDNTSGLTIN
ncbi:glycosyl hydrolase [Acidaminobacter sp. JC074]|uniref:glycosyl hydrolase n=1 Tax=Acidaminobacter sp. JC074 TaxID=2530199 RepID=UPI001F0D7354|nr:glycosyl hydrolase [Acidaminobacter sp. JC074]